MKSKNQKAKKATKKQEWHERAADLPLALFHTTVGAMIGRHELVPVEGGGKRIRLWAPAIMQVGFDKAGSTDTTMRQRVVFQPIAFIETHLDLSPATPFGSSPVPDAVVPGYEEYFAKVAAGNYALSRVMAKVEQAMPHEANMGSAPTQEASPVVAEVEAPTPDAHEPDEKLS